MYGSDGLNCSILFAPLASIEGYIPFNITCSTLLGYQILLAFASAVCVAGITLILSAACKNQMIALVVSCAIYVLPSVLPVTEASMLYKFIVLLPLNYSQFVSIMSIDQMNNGILYAIWAVPVALIIVVFGYLMSCRIFSKHQVS